jgi:hypothetical protein
MTKEEQVELNAIKDFGETRLRACREIADLVDWVDSRVNNQKQLVGEEDMPKYLKFEQKTKKMTQEAQECYDPNFKYGSLAEKVGKVGTENSFIHTA